MIDCVVKVLDYEAQGNIKNKKILECSKCPIKDKCNKFRKENDHGIK